MASNFLVLGSRATDLGASMLSLAIYSHARDGNMLSQLLISMGMFHQKQGHGSLLFGWSWRVPSSQRTTVSK